METTRAATTSTFIADYFHDQVWKSPQSPKQKLPLFPHLQQTVQKNPKIFIYVIIDKENHKIHNILSFVILKVSVRIVIAKINKILTE